MGAGPAAAAAPAAKVTVTVTGATPASAPAAGKDNDKSKDAPPGITVKDSQGRDVTLAKPAQRAVSLAPHATELIFAAGAGDKLAGVVKGSDFPPEALKVPSIGDGTQPDAERVATMRPDLVIAWLPGAAEPLLPVLRALKVPVFYSNPRTLAEIPDDVEKLGKLLGTSATAGPAAARLRDRLGKLAEQYARRKPLKVFIQAGREPLYTLNHESIVNDAVRICGGVNIFADGVVTAPQVSVEAVLARHPDAVIVGVNSPESLRDTAQAWNDALLPAALAGHVFGLDADTLYRPGPRLIDATEALCKALDQARTQPDLPPGSRGR
jgi:iron complex transport system substrate-binding protein/vitamin B12 transport system substrate-binding protein